MTLHADLEDFLDAMDHGFASGRPLMHEMAIQAAREEYERASLSIDQAGDAVAKIQPLTFKNRTGDLINLRQYTPRQDAINHLPLPAVLYFHGGGYCVGSLESHDSLCRSLCQRSQCQVFAVDYRLAPEHVFPAAVHDAEDAYLWLISQTELFQIDPGRIAVAGDSAGGTLATVISIQAAQQHWPKPLLQILLYPCTSSWQDSPSHQALAEGYMLEAETLQWMFKNYLSHEAERHDWRFAPSIAFDPANPANLAIDHLKSVAPAWIALAEYDPLRDEGLSYAQKLTDAGVSNTVKVYSGMIHDFARLGNIVETADQLRNDIAHVLLNAFKQ